MNSDDLVKKYESILGSSVDELLSIPRMFDSYKARAKFRGLKFELEFSTFDAFVKRPCTYCGHKEGLSGIDRVDSSEGYIIGNCVPCCWYCNRAKSDMSVEEFRTYIQRFNNVS